MSVAVAVIVPFPLLRDKKAIRKTTQLLLTVDPTLNVKIVIDKNSENWNVPDIPKDIPVKSVDTCQRWDHGLQEIFSGVNAADRALVFPGDLDLARCSRQDLVNGLREALAINADLVIGDYQSLDPVKEAIDAQCTKPLMECLFGDLFECNRIGDTIECKRSSYSDLKLRKPRSEIFVIKGEFYEEFKRAKVPSRWMPWEATVQLLIFAVKNGKSLKVVLLGKLDDEPAQRDVWGAIWQCRRMSFVLRSDYTEYREFRSKGQYTDKIGEALKIEQNAVAGFLYGRIP